MDNANKFFIVIFSLILIITVIIFTIIFKLEKEEKINLNNIKNELLSSDISREELFNKAFELGYKIGNKNESNNNLATGIVIGTTIQQMNNAAIKTTHY